MKKRGKRKKKRIKPYESLEDERLIWMKGTLLKFLEYWKSSVQAREGPFTATERQKMFLCSTRHMKDLRSL